MKIGKIGIFSIISVAALSLAGCTGAEDTPPPSATPKPTSSAELSQVRFAGHQEYLSELGKESMIIARSESKGSADIKLEAIPKTLDSVGFLVSCTPATEWEIQYSDGSLIGSSDCNDAPQPTAIIEIPTEQIKGDRVKLKIKNGTESWVTVYATTEND